MIHHAVLICAGGAIDVSDLQFSALSLAPDAGDPRSTAAAPPRRAREATDALRHAVIELLDLGTPALWQHIEDTVYRSVFDYSDHNQLRMSRLLDQSRNIVRAARAARHPEAARRGRRRRRRAAAPSGVIAPAQRTLRDSLA